MKRNTFIMLSMFAIVSCKQSSTLTESEKVMIRREISKTLHNYYEDIRKSGLKAEFKYLDSSQNFFWVPPGYQKAITYDSVATILNDNATKYTLIDNRFESLQIEPLSNEMAAYTGRIRSITTDTSGLVSHATLEEIGVFIKRTDGWKLLSGQTIITAAE